MGGPCRHPRVFRYNFRTLLTPRAPVPPPLGERGPSRVRYAGGPFGLRGRPGERARTLTPTFLLSSTFAKPYVYGCDWWRGCMAPQVRALCMSARKFEGHQPNTWVATFSSLTTTGYPAACSAARLIAAATASHSSLGKPMIPSPSCCRLMARCDGGRSATAMQESSSELELVVTAGGCAGFAL